MTIYISGPISGTDDYEERFARAEEALIAKGLDVINPVKRASALPTVFTYEQILRLDIADLDECDGIYMLRGWRDSRGASEEFRYAWQSDKTIIFEPLAD